MDRCVIFHAWPSEARSLVPDLPVLADLNETTEFTVVNVTCELCGVLRFGVVRVDHSDPHTVLFRDNGSLSTDSELL